MMLREFEPEIKYAPVYEIEDEPKPLSFDELLKRVEPEKPPIDWHQIR